MAGRTTGDSVGKAFRRALLICTALVPAACSMVPEYSQPESVVPDRYRGQSPEPASPTLPAPTTKWWTEFASAQLNQWIEAALGRNYDLKAAIQRVRLAELQAVAAGALRLPTAVLTGSRRTLGPEAGVGSVGQNQESFKSYRITQFGVRVSYEVDVWGKNAAAAESALARAEASEFDRQAVALSLVGDVVSAYLETLHHRNNIGLAERNAENLRSTLATVKAKAEVQEATQIELAQQAATLAQGEALIAVYRSLYEQSLNRLATLMGLAPAELPELDGKSFWDVAVPQPVPLLPSELLLRRPDIRKAEAGLRAANADVGIARAKLLPSFAFSSEGGIGNRFVSNLLSPQSFFFDILASLTQPLFDGGLTEAEIEYRKIKLEELTAQYYQSTLDAIREVEDFLATENQLANQERAESQQLAMAQRAYDLSSRAFTAGRIEYQVLLETERSLLIAQQTIANTRLSRLKGAVSLFKALGGDMTTKATQ